MAPPQPLHASTAKPQTTAWANVRRVMALGARDASHGAALLEGVGSRAWRQAEVADPGFRWEGPRTGGLFAT